MLPRAWLWLRAWAVTESTLRPRGMFPLRGGVLTDVAVSFRSAVNLGRLRACAETPGL